MGSILTGLIGTTKSLYTALEGNPTLVQLKDSVGNTIVQFDAVLNSAHTSTVDITQYPIEDGSSITDHIIRRPATLDLTVVATDTPISGVQNVETTNQAPSPTNNPLLMEAATVVGTAALPAFTVIAAAGGLAIWKSHQLSASPSIAVYNTLLAMQQGNADNPDPHLLTVQTKLGTMPNMIITSIGVPRDRETGDALIFTLKLQQIVIVASQTINVNKTDVPALARAKAQLGDQEADKAKPWSKFELGVNKFQRQTGQAPDVPLGGK